MDESELAYQARHGDTHSFEVLVRLYTGAIHSFLYRFLPDGDDVEDLAQEVFLKAYHNLSSYDESKGRFHSWLFRIAANASLDEIKRRERETARKDIAAQIQREVETPITSEENAKTIKALNDAIQSLTPIERQVILLFYYHDHSYQEIADTLGIPLGTVKSRMHNAISRIRQLVVLIEEGEVS